jgi:transposase-like protein
LVSRRSASAAARSASPAPRPLDRLYPVLFIDAIVVKIHDGQVTNRPV